MYIIALCNSHAVILNVTNKIMFFQRYHLYDACEEGNLLDVKRLLPDVDDINWVCGEDFETEVSFYFY